MAEEKVKAPKLLWAQIYDSAIGPVAATYTSDPREVHDNGKPVYQYVLVDAPNTRQRAERAAQAVINEFQGCMLVPDGYTHQMFYLRRLADIVTAEFDNNV